MHISTICKTMNSNLLSTHDNYNGRCPPVSCLSACSLKINIPKVNTWYLRMLDGTKVSLTDVLLMSIETQSLARRWMNTLIAVLVGSSPASPGTVTNEISMVGVVTAAEKLRAITSRDTSIVALLRKSLCKEHPFFNNARQSSWKGGFRSKV